MYLGCGGGAGLLSSAPELFLSEELGPVTVIRAPPSPGYAGDWVKIIFFFFTLTSSFTELPPEWECPLSSMPFGDSTASVPHVSPFNQWHWPAVHCSHCTYLGQQRKLELRVPERQEHYQQQKYVNGILISNLLTFSQHSQALQRPPSGARKNQGPNSSSVCGHQGA